MVTNFIFIKSLILLFLITLQAEEIYMSKRFNHFTLKRAVQNSIESIYFCRGSILYPEVLPPPNDSIKPISHSFFKSRKAVAFDIGI